MTADRTHTDARTTSPTGEDLLWPPSVAPTDLSAIEAVPLTARGLPESTYALLARAATRWPDRAAITVLPEAARWREPVQRTFADLLADVHRSANLLYGLGVRRGDAVALMAPHCAELVTGTLAAQLAGIAAPLNGALNRGHLAELLRRSGARVLLAAGPELSPATWQAAIDLAAEGILDVVLVLRPTAAAGPPPPLPAVGRVRIGYLGELAAGMDPIGFAGDPPGSADLAGLFHTGGTTGAPKLAAHTHANEVADAWMVATRPLFEPGSAVFAALPLFHVNALVVTLLAPLFRGHQAVWAGPLGYRDPPLFDEFWRIIEHYRIGVMSAVPTVYAVLAHQPVDADISSLRSAVVGASPLPAAVRAAFQATTGVSLTEGYGLTEATCASAIGFPDAPRSGTVGQRLPYQRLKAVRVAADGGWEDLPAGQPGALLISGPTVFPGYVVGRDEHGHVLDGMGKLIDGWLDTGDLAAVDKDGFVRLAGRAKDLIIRGGHNIDPAIVEDALLAHPQVTAAAAVGRPDAHAGEVPVAYVTVAAHAAATGPELRDWAAGRVAEPAAAPKEVVVLDSLPVTDVGKPYKVPLRADATRRALAAALDGIDPMPAVHTAVEDGSVVATVEVRRPADAGTVQSVLDRYAVAWKIAVKP